MRALFWRRKNIRFVSRLNTAIEKSEQVRKSYRPKPPRVVIDMSYVQEPAATDEADQAYEVEYADEAHEQDAEGAEGAEGFEHEAADEPAMPGQARHHLDEMPAAADDTHIAALAEIEAWHSEQAALRAAEAREREMVAWQEVEAQRELAARLEAEALNEQAARREAEAQRAQADRRAAEAHRELEELRAALQQSELAAGREAEARQHEIATRQAAEAHRELAASREAEALREHAARLETEAQREAVARREAEALLEQAARRTAEAHRELEALRAAEVRQREIAARQAAEAQRELASRIEAEAQRELEAVREAEARQREIAARQAAEAQRELAARIEAEAQREDAARREAEAHQREIAARRAAEAQRELAARLEREAIVEAEAAAPAISLASSIDPHPTQAQHPVEHPVAPLPQAPSAAAARAQRIVSRPSGVPPTVASTAPAPAPSASKPTEDKAEAAPVAATADADRKQRDRRVTAQTPATLWNESMSQALTCTIRDRSPTGAMLEFGADKYNSEITEIVVGDRLTLTMRSAQETTSVACVVVRIDGRRCGLRFCGQFHTQINKSRKVASAKAAPDNSRAGRPVKSGFASGGAAKAPSRR